MVTPNPRADGRFHEVADRVWVARHAWLDVNLTAVEGDRGLLLVDTLGSEAALGAALDALAAVTTAPVVGAVNTHAHFDHVLGNAALLDRYPGAALLAHEETAAAMREESYRARADEDCAGSGEGTDHEERCREARQSRVAPPTDTFVSVAAVDLGDRVAEIVFAGRGHTAGDIVVRVPDADVVVAGDLVEQSAPPSYGPDCFPLEWPAALDSVAGLLTPRTVVVPGHGAIVDQEFVTAQRSDVGVVAETVYDLASRSVPLEEALRHEEWPFPAHLLAHAVRRGYDHVPRTARRLPLV